jgi:hypothetical protein
MAACLVEMTRRHLKVRLPSDHPDDPPSFMRMEHLDERLIVEPFEIESILRSNFLIGDITNLERANTIFLLSTRSFFAKHLPIEIIDSFEMDET